MSNISNLRNNEGTIIEVSGKRIGVINVNGEVSGLSLVCKHRGCEVEFNADEKTWDCPCHGSRYNLDGSLMKGPAKSGLDSVMIKIESGKVELK